MPRPAQQVVDEIVAAGGQAVANYDSISTFADAKALVDQAVETFGGLDVVINNAGILRDQLSFNMAEAEWDAVIAVHLKGHFAVAPRGCLLAGQGQGDGRAGRRRRSSTRPASPVSTATPDRPTTRRPRRASPAMTIVLARELERIGVRVNCIAPVARTRLTEALAGDYMKPDETGFDRFAPEQRGRRRRAGWRPTSRRGIYGQVVKVQGGSSSCSRAGVR